MFQDISHTAIQRGPSSPPPKKMGDPLPTFKQFENLYDNTCGVVVCFWGVSHAPVPRGRGPSGPKFVTTSYVHPHSMRNNKQIFHVIKLDLRENFKVSTTNADVQSACSS